VSEIFAPKIIKNLVIDFQVTVENVGNVFETQCIIAIAYNRQYESLFPTSFCGSSVELL